MTDAELQAYRSKLAEAHRDWSWDYPDATLTYVNRAAESFSYGFSAGEKLFRLLGRIEALQERRSGCHPNSINFSGLDFMVKEAESNLAELLKEKL